MTLKTNESGVTKWPPGERLLLVLILTCTLMIGAYLVLRYRGQWMESDSGGMISYIASMQRTGELQGTTRVYTHGFTYQALSLYVMATTGLSSLTLQTIVFPPLAVVGLGLAAAALYTQVARSKRVALLSTLFLTLQPDLLFVTIRASHEKLDWPLTMVALLLFYRSIGRSPRTTWVYVGLFYLVVFAMASVNLFFASSFLVAIMVSLLLGQTVRMFRQRRRLGTQSDLSRLIYVSLSCGVVIFVFMVYVYPPALAYVKTLSHAWDRTSALVLGFQETAEPYASIPAAWVSRPVYLGLTAFTWVILAVSFLAWLWRGKQILFSRIEFDLARDLDWLLYAGFAVQVAMGVIVDLSGVLSSNMQLRILPGFVIWGVVFFTRAMWGVFEHPWLSGWKRRFAIGLIVIALTWFAVAAAFKATNEPVLGNWWLFYTQSEDAALLWSNEYIDTGPIWTAVDDRVRTGFRVQHLEDTQNVGLDSFAIKFYDRYLLLSTAERFRRIRMGVGALVTWDWHSVYDNGEVSMAHRRPRTPYQR
ncbi:MAG: hypothetical protein JXA14_20140 [Anaerolineae bacterium]|nr:hypothetical protein [Anaerolineae bacterium]